MNLRKLTAEDVEFIVSVEPEEIDVRGNFMATDLDRAAEDEIIGRLNRGDEFAWCCIRVEARWNGFSASDYLGCCSYANMQEIEAAARDHGMHKESLDRLNETIASEAGRLAPLMTVKS